ncbi:HAMP domain-containing sensor histidine kinase [Thalassovita sp.]|uniref:sensor histidine kinase n=1 Tax=Thalassovita sp. TaxID=1979401 RepID=UPI0029DE6A76|nr:HAMP domain-containing sensor histidine kinase [Thalassovita sp.]
MRQQRSASLRVTLLVAAGIILLSLAAMAVQYRVTAQSLDARQAELLRADLDAFAALYEQRRIVALRQAIEFRVASTPPDQVIYLLMDRDVKLAGNIDSWPQGLARDGAGFSADGAQPFAHAGVAYVGVARELPGGFPFLVAHARTDVLATLSDLRRLIGWVALALAVVALAAGWLVSRAVLGRIGRLNALADRVAGGELSARLPTPAAQDEFAVLQDHVHNMLDRIEALNRATRRLSDSIAHELRTPLNRIQQRLAALPGQADAEAAQAEIRTTIRIFDALLDISAAEAASGQRPGLVPVDLSALVAEVFDLYDPVAEDAGLSCTADIAPGLRVLGERSLLAQLLSNLLDNAIKYCRAGDEISLSLIAGNNRVVLSLSDTGPGIPDDLRNRMFDRFARADRDREKAGHGLGLALVQAIAARHGAKLSLPETSRGFAIRVSFPNVAGDT